MVVGLKDAAKFTGIFIISCCAVFVCTLFLNFNMDMAGIRDEIAPGPVTVFYEAQVSSGKMKQRERRVPSAHLCGHAVLLY